METIASLNQSHEIQPQVSQNNQSQNHGSYAEIDDQPTATHV